MSKTVRLTVELKFADKIYSDDDMAEIVQNTMFALIEQANSVGLAPTNSDTFTTSIRVSDNHGTEQNHKFI